MPVGRVVIVLVTALLIAFFARREQIKKRKRRRRAMQRAYLRARRRGMIDVVDTDRYLGPEPVEPGDSPVQIVSPNGDRWVPEADPAPRIPRPEPLPRNGHGASGTPATHDREDRRPTRAR